MERWTAGTNESHYYIDIVPEPCNLISNTACAFAESCASPWMHKQGELPLKPLKIWFILLPILHFFTLQYVLRNHEQPRKKTLIFNFPPQVGKVRKSAARKREYHILFMVLTTAACYLLCWMPYGVVAMMATFGPPNIISPVASVVPSLLAKSSTVINPLIYILMNKQVSQKQRLSIFNVLLPKFSPSQSFENQGTVWHWQQLYLHGKKRQITSAEIIQMVYLNIISSVRREFTDKSKSRRTP